MRHLQSFNLFESSSHLTLEQIKFLDDHTRGTWQLNGDGKVNVEGDFVCSGEDLDDLKGLKFGKVSGDFRCANNNIKSLEGVPSEVGGDFWFSNNYLQTLDGAPEKVGGNFRCQPHIAPISTRFMEMDFFLLCLFRRRSYGCSTACKF